MLLEENMADLIDSGKLLREYKNKNDTLKKKFGEHIEPKKFYNDIFDYGVDLQKKDEIGNGKGNIIVVSKADHGEGQLRRYTIHAENNFADLDVIPVDDFAFTSAISYYGKNRTLKNARFMYAMVIDLDGVTDEKIKTGLFVQIKNEIIPRPTYIVNSGTGLHLYYKFVTPVPMYPAMRDALNKLKKSLIKLIWNPYITNIKKPQVQSINQGFRLVGGETKALMNFEYSTEHRRYIAEVLAYKSGDNVTLDYMQHFIYSLDIDWGSVGIYNPKIKLEVAKEKYPEWYQHRIVEGRPKGQWFIKRDLYDWWKRKLIEEVTVGHRYWCLYALTSYAVKCGIEEKELKSDLKVLQKTFDNMGGVPFTVNDMKDAMKLYKDKVLAAMLTRNFISEQTAILIIPNKRNGRKQTVHLEGARAIQQINDKANGTDWREGNGRKTKENMIREWRFKNPNGKKADCIRDTGLSKPTVYKWWV
jgi:hypothetical protein